MNTWLSGMSPGSTISGAFGSTAPGSVVGEIGTVVVGATPVASEPLHEEVTNAAATAAAAIVDLMRIIHSSRLIADGFDGTAGTASGAPAEGERTARTTPDRFT
jgi:hypothetical protein